MQQERGAIGALRRRQFALTGPLLNREFSVFPRFHPVPQVSDGLFRRRLLMPRWSPGHGQVWDA